MSESELAQALAQFVHHHPTVELRKPLWML